MAALTTETRRWVYTGDGVTTGFSYDNYIVANADLAVYLELIASPYTQTLQTLTTHYSVTGVGAIGGGNVVMVTAPAATHRVVIVSKIPNTQPSDFDPRKVLSNTAHTLALHRLAAEVQQLAAKLDRSVRLGDGDSASLAAMAAYRSFYSKYLYVDAAGVIQPTAATDIAVSAAMEPVVLAATLAAARAAFAVPGLAEVNTFTKSQIWAKGADIASAATLVLGTDGNFFDVTGATGPITAITVPAGKLFMLQFDAAPQLTHGAALKMPYNANHTMAAGDRLVAFAVAANTVEVLGIARASATSARADIAAAGTAAVNTFTAAQIWAKGADIASAAALALGADGNFFDVTGATGPITSITAAAGTLFMLHFDSTPTLTHHATNLNLPGGANIVAAAGDRLIGFATAANQVEVLRYQRATPELAFSVFNNTLRTDVTGDTTSYTVPFDGESGSGAFDPNGLHAAGVFTCPRAGVWHFDACVHLNGGVAHVEGQLTIEVNAAYGRIFGQYVPAGTTEFRLAGGATFNLAAGDTVLIKAQVGGGTATKVLDIPASAAGTMFCGHFVG